MKNGLTLSHRQAPLHESHEIAASSAVAGDDPQEHTGAKRAQRDVSVLEPPPKRVKSNEHHGVLESGYRSKARLTHSRREKEILQIVTDSGGILNISSKEFYAAHAALVESIIKAGGVASTLPGSRIDKRTVEATIKDLEAHQKIKCITTSVPTPTGGQRLVRSIFLPDISEEEVTVFISELHIQQATSTTQIRTLDDSVTYARPKKGNSKQRASAPSAVLDALPRKDPALVQKLFDSSDDVIRDTLMSERNTLAQSYGFVVGRMARARELHLSTMKALESVTTSTHIVSVEERIVSLAFYFSDLPISTYCALIPFQTESDELTRLLNSPDGKILPVGSISSEMREVLQVSRWRSRDRLLDLFEILCRLQLVEPLQASDSGSPALMCATNGIHPTSFDAAPIENWKRPSAPMYWRFNKVAPLYLWALSEDQPPFWKNVPIHNIFQGIEFWRELEKISRDKEFSLHILPLVPNVPVQRPDQELGRSLRRTVSWTASYSLSWYQGEYLRHLVDQSNGSTPLQDDVNGEERLNRISSIVSAPKDVIRRYFEKARDRYLKEHDKIQRKRERRSADAKAKQAKTKALLEKKAAEARVHREEDWDNVVKKVHPEPLKGSVAIRVRRVRARYMQSSGGNSERWESEISQAIQEATITAKRVLSSNKLPLVRTMLGAVPLPPVVANPSEKSIEDLIAQQGPSLPARASVKKEKKDKESHKGMIFLLSCSWYQS